MVDDLKPRYTTKRLRQEIERARENDARHIAALEAQLAERVKVKPLGWVRDDDAGCFHAETELGEYIAWDNGRVQFGAFGASFVDGGSVGARSKAQADYERRARSTFEATPPAPKDPWPVHYANTTAPGRFAAPAPKVTEDWLRDTAMDVMLATEVGEAVRILSDALESTLLTPKATEAIREFAAKQSSTDTDIQAAICDRSELYFTAPKVTATTDHDPKLGTTLHLMKQSWESRQPTNSGAPKVTDEMVERALDAMRSATYAAIKSEEGEGLDIQKLNFIGMRAALTAAQEAGKP